MSACASHPRVSATEEAAQYAAHARRDYTPPGPPQDPWGPYITEASKRFDVPERWIREVMRVESGGQLYHSNGLVTSPVGAMGLMQVMPATYDGLQSRYNLGSDPYDPHDNLLAGAAYIREMYDLYGSPGFLAAYNAGPGRLDDYLTRNRALPDETRRYVAKIAPYIADSYPQNRSPAEQFAMNSVPFDFAGGTRYGRGSRSSRYADTSRYAEEPRSLETNTREPVRAVSLVRPVQVVQLAEPPRGSRYASLPAPPVPPAPPVQTAATYAPPSRTGGFRLISEASAEPLPAHRGGPTTGGWAIQVGAFANEGLAHSATGSARDQARDMLGHTRVAVTPVRDGHSTLYRARLMGMSREGAIQACQRLARSHTNCMIVSPDAQS